MDLWQVASNRKDGVMFASPKTTAEREGTAEMCVVRLAIKLPAVIDDIDNRTERAYTGWPDRLYIVGTDGRIQFKSKPGPYGFSTSDLEKRLNEILASPRSR